MIYNPETMIVIVTVTMAGIITSRMDMVTRELEKIRHPRTPTKVVHRRRYAILLRVAASQLSDSNVGRKMPICSRDGQSIKNPPKPPCVGHNDIESNFRYSEGWTFESPQGNGILGTTHQAFSPNTSVSITFNGTSSVFCTY